MKRLLICAAAVALAAAAAAQTSSATATATSGDGHSSAASFACGGVGVGDQDRMKAEAASHDMFLTFASTTGAYVADVDFRIASRSGGVVLQGHCAGPLMVVDLGGKGSYQVTATFDGKSQSKTVTVGGKPARASFVWAVS
jgi:hypothetical protein